MKRFLTSLLLLAIVSPAAAATWSVGPKPSPSFNHSRHNHHRGCNVYVIRETRPSRRVQYKSYNYTPPKPRYSGGGGGGYYSSPKYVEPLMIINPYFVKD